MSPKKYSKAAWLEVDAKRHTEMVRANRAESDLAIQRQIVQQQARSIRHLRAVLNAALTIIEGKSGIGSTPE